MIRTASPVLVICVLGFATIRAQTAAVPQHSYVWYGEFVSLDAAGNATVKAQMRDHVGMYVGRFKPGDELLLVWDMSGKTPRADHVMALWEYDNNAKAQPAGYILPIRFVSADVPSKTITFSAHVPTSAMSVLKSITPGQTLEATAPVDQPSREAMITAIKAADGSQGAAAAR